MIEKKDIHDELLEEWDWESARPLGRSVERKKAHREGIAHEGVHLWIVRNISTAPELLFQHRSPLKEMYPDVLDITVGGHVVFGQIDGKIQKESYEEIGIIPNARDMFDLGYFRYEEKTDTLFHREFQHIYLLADNRELDSYIFVDGEVIGIYAVPVDDLKQLFMRDFVLSVSGYNGNELERRTVAKKDFHPLLFSPSMSEYMSTLFRACEELSTDGRITIKMPVP